jgi:hypothetical protein
MDIKPLTTQNGPISAVQFVVSREPEIRCAVLKICCARFEPELEIE